MNVTELIERLRYSRYEHDNGIGDEAADALEAQARELEQLRMAVGLASTLSGKTECDPHNPLGWMQAVVLDVTARLAAAVWPCKTYDKDGKLLTVCHNLATAERERDEAVALLREAPLGQHDRGWWNRIDAFLAADSATHRETPVT